MTFVTAILAKLILVVSQGSIERSKFTKLIALVIVFALWRRCSCFDDLIDEPDAFLDCSFVVCGNDTMHFFFVLITSFALAVFD